MPDQSPPVDEVLVRYLEEIFPDRCPAEGDNERKVWINAGAAKVVRHLRLLSERQRTNVLE